METEQNIFNLPVLKNKISRYPIATSNANTTPIFKIITPKTKKTNSSVGTSSSLRQQKISDKNMINSTQLKIYIDIYDLTKTNMILKKRTENLEMLLNKIHKSMKQLLQNQNKAIFAITLNRINKIDILHK